MSFRPATGSGCRYSSWSIEARPSRLSPQTSRSSRNPNGRSRSMVISQRDSLAISTASGLMSAPYRQCSATCRRASSSTCSTSASAPMRRSFSVLLSGERVAAAFGAPGFHEPVGEVSAGSDQERAGPHRDVGDAQLQDLSGRPGPPGRSRPLCRAGRAGRPAAAARRQRLPRRAIEECSGCRSRRGARCGPRTGRRAGVMAGRPRSSLAQHPEQRRDPIDKTQVSTDRTRAWPRAARRSAPAASAAPDPSRGPAGPLGQPGRQLPSIPAMRPPLPA